mmetsp:Transcript_6577/g.9980  ORF Transcript_6577/g.9980 Transcript_6577/m.9980 type:complete len:182 (-) Transcript_6577:285-830(-)
MVRSKIPLAAKNIFLELSVIGACYISQSSCEIQMTTKRGNSRRSLSSCEDNPSFLTALGIPCAAHKGINCPSMSLLGLTHQEVDELLDKCPLACGECKELMPNTPKPTKDPTTKPTPSPTVNPTRNPTLKPTKHQSSCSDDSKYISKLGVACADHAGINCNAMLLLGFTEAEMKDLFFEMS